MNVFTLPVVLMLGMQPVQALSLALTPELFDLPDGEHYFVAARSNELTSNELTSDRTLFLRKWGRIVVGVDTISSQATCFKGFVEENAIVGATRVLPPYTPNAEWTYQSGKMIDLGGYDRQIEAIAATDTATDRTALDTCLEVFSR